MSFERILINLIDNANKYAPGRILVTTSEAGGMLTLSVRISAVVSIRRASQNAGPGPAGRKRQGWFGLGLVVVRELAEANGGRVTIENAEPGLRVTASMKIKDSA